MHVSGTVAGATDDGACCLCGHVSGFQIGADKYCQKSLTTSWAVCSVPLGDGVGTVTVRLSRPVGIVNFTAAPLSITGPDNDAASDPIGLSHAASLSLLVEFDDGSVKDFSKDPRTTFTVSAASLGFCKVAPGRWMAHEWCGCHDQRLSSCSESCWLVKLSLHTKVAKLPVQPGVAFGQFTRGKRRLQGVACLSIMATLNAESKNLLPAAPVLVSANPARQQ